MNTGYARYAFKMQGGSLRHKVIKVKTDKTSHSPSYLSHGAETVPDTEDYILLDKIGMVWEYTREYTSIHSKSGTNTKYTEYTCIWDIC